MFRANIACQPAGRFSGPLVVSMRSFKPADAIRAIQITSRYPSVHGAPVHIGLPEAIGIADLMKPGYGGEARFRHHARTWQHARDRPEEYRYGGVLTCIAKSLKRAGRVLLLAVFPLTPALSHRERESRRARC
jgi:hypothetical protein